MNSDSILKPNYSLVPNQNIRELIDKNKLVWENWVKKERLKEDLRLLYYINTYGKNYEN